MRKKARSYEYRAVYVELPKELHDQIVRSVADGSFVSKTAFLIKASENLLNQKN